MNPKSIKTMREALKNLDTIKIIDKKMDPHGLGPSEWTVATSDGVGTTSSGSESAGETISISKKQLKQYEKEYAKAIKDGSTEAEDLAAYVAECGEKVEAAIVLGITKGELKTAEEYCYDDFGGNVSYEDYEISCAESDIAEGVFDQDLIDDVKPWDEMSNDEIVKYYREIFGK
jgi:hypothetical protein